MKLAPYSRQSIALLADLPVTYPVRIFAGSQAWDWCHRWWKETSERAQRPVVCLPPGDAVDRYRWDWLMARSVFLHFSGDFDDDEPARATQALLQLGIADVSLFCEHANGTKSGDWYVSQRETEDSAA